MMVAWAVTGFLLCIALVLRLLYNHSRLKSIPGPFFAAISDTWRVHARNSPGYGRRLAQLHQGYGDVVRIGPNVVSICEHVEIANISRRRLWEELVQNGRRLSDSSVTSTNQIRWHLREIQDYEGSIDESLKNIIKSIRRHRVLDLPSSLRYFAEDFINRVMINDPSINDDRTAGMPKTNTPSTQLSTATILCSMEDMVLKGPVSLLKRERFSCSGIGSSMSKLPEYATELISNPIRAAAQPLTPRDSILSIGIESMTATFVSTFCFLLSNPIVMATLKSEINTMLRFREKAAIPSWSEIRRYSYLDAVQKESMRHFTSRSETQEILGTASSWNHSRLPLPPKTIVTWHPHVLQFDRSVYGDDVNTFRPGRWLVTDTTQRNLMEKSLLPFNVCVEAYPIAQAAWLELKKAVVVLLSNFDLELLDADADSEIHFHGDVPMYPPPSMLVRFRPRIP